MGQMNIDEIKAQLPGGIWFLTGGNLKLQNLLESTYEGEELQEKLELVKVAMKLQSKDDKLLVTMIHRSGEIDGQILPRGSIVIFPQENGELHFLIEKVGEMIYADTIEKSLEKVINAGLITRDEYIKYSDPGIWDNLPRVEFKMIIRQR